PVAGRLSNPRNKISFWPRLHKKRPSPQRSINLTRYKPRLFARSQFRYNATFLFATNDLAIASAPLNQRHFYTHDKLRFSGGYACRTGYDPLCPPVSPPRLISAKPARD